MLANDGYALGEMELFGEGDDTLEEGRTITSQEIVYQPYSTRVG